MAARSFKCPFCHQWRYSRIAFDDHLFIRHNIADANISGEGDFTRVITYNQGTSPMEPNTPVTEAEMTSFFSRLTTHVVSLSAQAKELEGVKVALTELERRVNEVTDENARLKKERDDAVLESMQAVEDRDSARTTLQEIEKRHAAVLDTMVRRDSKITEMEGLLTSVRMESQDWQRKCECADQHVTVLKGDIEVIRERRDHWREKAEKAEAALAEANKKLEDFKQQAAAIFGLIDKPEPVQEAAPQPDPTAGVASTGTGNASENSAEPVSEVPAEPVPTAAETPSSSGGHSGPQPSTASTQGSEPSPRPWWENKAAE